MRQTAVGWAVIGWAATQEQNMKQTVELELELALRLRLGLELELAGRLGWDPRR